MQIRESSRAERVSVQLVVELRVDAEVREVDLVNLSLNGAFVEYPWGLLAEGSRVEISLPMPDGPPMRIASTVRRAGICQKQVLHPGLDLVVRTTGVGLEFDELSDPDAQRLQDFLDLAAER